MFRPGQETIAIADAGPAPAGLDTTSGTGIREALRAVRADEARAGRERNAARVPAGNDALAGRAAGAAGEPAVVNGNE